jgi:hypothetical protein
MRCGQTAPVFRKRMKRVITITSLVWICGFAAASSGPAADFSVDSLGARYGFLPSSSRGDFRQAEAYSNWKLPWVWNINTNWSLATRLDLSAGSLYKHPEVGFVGTLGQSVVLERKGLPFALVSGVSPTLISRYRYGDTDFGEPFQFTSQIGLSWRPGAHLELSYRFQHMSNAGINDNNSGLNLHMFGIGYRF